MITFHLREFAHTFTFYYGIKHTLVIPAQDITFEDTFIQNPKYLEFEGFEHVMLKLTSFTHCPQPREAFKYPRIGGLFRNFQILPGYDEITVEIVGKEDGVVYDTFTHRQDITSNTRRLETVC